MPSPGWLNRLRALGWVERIFIVLLILVFAAELLNLGGGLRLLLNVVAGAFAVMVLWRLGLQFVRRSIWRLRNRLIVSYIFVAVVPVLLIAILAMSGAWMVAGQICAYLLNNEMDRRVNSLRQTATSLARVAPEVRAEAVRRAGFLMRDRNPGLEILVRNGDGTDVRYPAESALTAPPSGHKEIAGLLIRDGLFYLWAHSGGPQPEVVILIPITRNYLQSLVTDLGEVQLAPRPLSPDEVRELDARLHPPLPGEMAVASPGIPRRANLLDLPVKWGVTLPVSLWQKPGVDRPVFLGVATRISGALNKIFSVETNYLMPPLLVFFSAGALLFFIVELASAYIGIGLSRTITSAVHDLYEATVRIREGDLAHRVEVRGNDQLAELGTSFNIMAGNLERLIASEKERQKLEAELEIASEVQNQLHPKPLEGMGSLRIWSVCNAARMVSGDYFDYQTVGDSRLALVLGDVAGKGISAALLMATLQSAMRSQLRHCVESAAMAAVGSGDGYGVPHVSTAQFVSNLNQQLYASTAPEKYATFFFSVYDDSNDTLTYTNAGHLSPVLIRKDKAIPLDSNGMVVGAFPFARYGESRVQLESGDLLVCYTDGITEPENAYGEMFGEERLIELLLANAHRDGGEVAALVVEEVTKWTASPDLQDDMTLLLARKV